MKIFCKRPSPFIYSWCLAFQKECFVIFNPKSTKDHSKLIIFNLLSDFSPQLERYYLCGNCLVARKASTTMREKSVHKMELNYIVKCIRKRLLLIKKKRHSKSSILNSPVMMTAYECFLNKPRKNIRKCLPFLVVVGDITQGLVHACQVFQLPLRYTPEPEMETICIHWWKESRRYARNKLDVLDHFMERWVKLATTSSHCLPYRIYMKIQTTSLGKP